MKLKGWEERFDERFLVVEQWTGLAAGSPPVNLRKEIKSFIAQELQKQKEEIVEMIKDIKHPEEVIKKVEKIDEDGKINAGYARVQNQMADDIIKKIGGE